MLMGKDSFFQQKQRNRKKNQKKKKKNLPHPLSQNVTY